MGWQGRGVWRVGPRFREGGMVLPPPTTLPIPVCLMKSMCLSEVYQHYAKGCISSHI